MDSSRKESYLEGRIVGNPNNKRTEVFFDKSFRVKYQGKIYSFQRITIESRGLEKYVADANNVRLPVSVVLQLVRNSLRSVENTIDEWLKNNDEN